MIFLCVSCIPAQCANRLRDAGGRHGTKAAGGRQRPQGTPPNPARQQRVENWQAQGWSEEEWYWWQQGGWQQGDWQGRWW